MDSFKSAAKASQITETHILWVSKPPKTFKWLPKVNKKDQFSVKTCMRAVERPHILVFKIQWDPGGKLQVLPQRQHDTRPEIPWGAFL